jgi:hypothetical protein
MLGWNMDFNLMVHKIDSIFMEIFSNQSFEAR